MSISMDRRLVIFSCCFLLVSALPAPPRGETDGVVGVVDDDPSSISMRGYVEGDTGVTDWYKVGQKELNRQLQQTINTNIAKNVILFIGDGLGMTTSSPARIYHAQSRGLIGDDAKLSFEKFPHIGVSVPYSVNEGVIDSAAAATAILCGEKVKYGTVGVNQRVERYDCWAQEGNELKSALTHAIEAGKDTGIVVNSRITHATPAAAYAHSASRSWEVDADVPSSDRYICKDVASQLIDTEINQKIRVLLGGGRRHFRPDREPDPEYPTSSSRRGQRLDGRDLTQEWVKQKVDAGTDPSAVAYVMDKDSFDAVDPDKTQFLMGLFEPSHMQYDANRNDPDEEPWGEPSLTEMTEKAILMLNSSQNGFFLMVEGSRIDLAHHGNKAFNALNETVSFSDAVQKALELTSLEDTLIVVTADHSHAVDYQGYGAINSDILGITNDGFDEDGDLIVDDMGDGKPGFLLTYANGPGFEEHREDGDGDLIPRRDPQDDYEDGVSGKSDYRYDAGVYLSTAAHGGEDVLMYAHGPMSHLFLGSHEQNYIAHAIMYAACLGNSTQHCDLPL